MNACTTCVRVPMLNHPSKEAVHARMFHIDYHTHTTNERAATVRITTVEGSLVSERVVPAEENSLRHERLYVASCLFFFAQSDRVLNGNEGESLLPFFPRCTKQSVAFKMAQKAKYLAANFGDSITVNDEQHVRFTR